HRAPETEAADGKTTGANRRGMAALAWRGGACALGLLSCSKAARRRADPANRLKDPIDGRATRRAAPCAALGKGKTARRLSSWLWRRRQRSDCTRTGVAVANAGCGIRVAAC